MLVECHHWCEQALSVLPEEYADKATRLGLQARLAVSAMFTRGNSWTVRQVLEEKALCGTNMAIVGSPTQVADELINWMDETDLDGFNIARIVAHETYEHFIDLVVPVLQERGRYKTEYAPGTFRQKLLGIDRIPDTHLAGSFRA